MSVIGSPFLNSSYRACNSLIIKPMKLVLKAKDLCPPLPIIHMCCY